MPSLQQVSAVARGCNISLDNDSIQFLIYLRAELNSQWPITESARVKTTVIKNDNNHNNINNDDNNNNNKSSCVSFYSFLYQLSYLGLIIIKIIIIQFLDLSALSTANGLQQASTKIYIKKPH
jgi:hypothetical protein